jgi:hypothetical protein
VVEIEGERERNLREKGRVEGRQDWEGLRERQREGGEREKENE